MPTVVVTGANRGLGLEMARQFAEAGWKVIAAARDPESSELKGVAGGKKNVERFALDVTDEASVKQFAGALAGRAVDLLINNAGIFPSKGNKLGEIDYPAWLDTFQANTLGPVRMTEALLPNLEQGERKLVVVISSGMGSIGTFQEEGSAMSGQAMQYRTSKAAVNMAVAIMADALKPKGITVIAQCPGWVRTDMGGKNATYSPEQSISALRAIWDGITLNDTASYFAHTGKRYPW